MNKKYLKITLIIILTFSLIGSGIFFYFKNQNKEIISETIVENEEVQEEVKEEVKNETPQISEEKKEIPLTSEEKTQKIGYENDKQKIEITESNNNVTVNYSTTSNGNDQRKLEGYYSDIPANLLVGIFAEAYWTNSLKRIYDKKIELSSNYDGKIFKFSSIIYHNKNIMLKGENKYIIKFFDKITKKEVEELKKEFTINVKYNDIIKVYSPVYTLTGTVLDGTTKVKVKWENGNTKDEYELKQFKAGDKEFLTNLRLDYGNIGKGENRYTIEFYKENELIGSDEYLIVAEYEEIKLSKDIIVYLKNKINNYDNIIIVGNDYIELLSKVVVNYYGKIILADKFIYEKNIDKFSYIDLKSKNIGGFCDKTGIVDYYVNNRLIKSNIKLIDCDGFYMPDYNEKENILSVGFLYGNLLYFLNNGTIKYYDYYFPGYISSISLGLKYDENKEKLEKNQKNSKYLYVTNKTHSYMDGSSFSLKKQDYQKNYIFNQKYEFKFDKSQAYDDKSFYEAKIGDKNFKLDYDELVSGNHKMKLAECLNLQLFNNKDDYYFKLGSGDSLGCENISKIGVTSCKENYSKEYDKEYILQTKEEKEKDGEKINEFKYNISEKLNNKCDIPYKITVYYEDGKTETGEYYVLFDEDL